MGKENQLNKKQREWLNNFLATRPHHHYRVFTILAGTRTIEIEWTEEANRILLPDEKYIATKIKHTIKVVLRFSGHPIKSGEYKCDILPPQRYTNYNLYGQLSLDIPQHYEIKFPENPVIVKHRIRRPKNRNKICRINAKSLETNQQKLTFPSRKLQEKGINEQELSQTSKVGNIELPTVLINMLNEKGATESDFILTSIAFKDGGIEAALNYIDTIEQLRKLRNE
ncbi:hypothetical protein NIES4071_102120 (plasmid) [Calothrix sp. NIES-4071]|nr:hypothetical protein NIES4071_102120 [Calothrix sp. NIES-4071]BAZ64593.1 hypothetical protein NIES4105_103260 [Calothrix sp. NIES-4105]